MHQVLSFRSAVKKGLICDYKVVISIVVSDDINRELLKRGEVVVDGDVIEAQRIANILAMQSAIDKHGIKRIFSFHNSVSNAKSFTAKTNEGIGAYLKGFTTLHVNGEMGTSMRENFLKEFEESDKAIISNARCLTEGVNVPVVDMVAFISPKKSQIDIVQAIGRAMRNSPGKEIGYVLIPLFVQLADGESLEQALEKTKFSAMWDVLQAMQEQDESLVEIIAQMREDIGRALGYNDNRLMEKVEVLGPELCISELRKAINTNIIDRLGLSWDERFGNLVQYKEEYGDCNVPLRCIENRALGNWVIAQRQRYKKGILSVDKITKLTNLGFIWDFLDEVWEEKFSELCKFKETYGHCNVPSSIGSNNKLLGVWVVNQRINYRRGVLCAERIERLNNLGFSWHRFDSKWEQMYDDLCKFKAIYGNCDVPRNYNESKELASWVGNQRQYHKQGILSKKRLECLEAINLNFTPFDAIWEERFAELVKFKAQYGHCNVPIAKNKDLGMWAGTMQRRAYKKGKLSPERIKRLEEIGFEWDPYASVWEERFGELIKFKEQHGHCDVPSDYPENPTLAKWVKHRRENYKKKNLAQININRLNGIGFDWDRIVTAWENMFSALCDFKKEYGHCNVPQGYQKNPSLGGWVSAQRQRYKKKQLKQNYIDRLNELGFVWDRKA